MRMLSMLAAAMLFTGAVANSARAEEFNARTTLIIDQPIDRGTMAPVMEKMGRFMAAEKAPKEIKLIIDSPGGSVYTGFQFIAQMKGLQARGTKVTCYVPGLAASMAFHILVHCDERIVLQESALLWHRARIFVMMAALTAPLAAVISRDLQQVDDHILRDVKEALSKDLNNEDIVYHFEHETLHIGQDLCSKAPNFCTAKAAVPGLLETLARQDMVHTLPVPNDLFNKENILYIHFKYLKKIFSNK